MKIMKLLTEAVKRKIIGLLPPVFALVFDGWTLGQTHYLGVFATFPDGESKSGYKQVFLSFSPLTNEESLNAENHTLFFDFLLQYYGKSWLNFAALIGDNCATNQSFARRVKSYFIGCASHWFNLAMKVFFDKHKDLLKKINHIMCQLKNLLPAVKIRKHTHLKPKTMNTTQWSSTFEVILRFKEISHVLPLVEINEINEHLLSVKENQGVDTICKI